MLMSNNEYEYCSNELYDGFLQSLANSNCNGNQLTSLSPSDPASPGNSHHDQHHQQQAFGGDAGVVGVGGGGGHQVNGSTIGTNGSSNFGGNIGHSGGGVNNHSTQAIMASMQAVSLQSSPGKSYTDYIDELASDLDSRYWESKPPHQWTSEDVWHWIFSWAGDRSVDVEEIHPLAYSNMTGEQLCSMSRTDFVNLNPRYGGDIFDTLQQLSNRFNLFRSCSPSSSSNLADVAIGMPNQASLTALMASVHSPNANSASPSSSPCSLSSSSPSSLCSSSSPSTSESSPNAMNGSYVSSNVLPSFDLLRSSCSLDLECHGGHHSPSSNVSESDRDSTSSTLTTVNDRNHYLLGQNGTVHLSNLHSSHHQNLCPDDLTNLTGSNAQGTTQHHLLPTASSSSPSSSSSSSPSSSSPGSSSGGSIAPPPYQLVSDHSLTSALLMPMKKVGRRGRPPKRESKSRSRQGKGNGKLWEFIRDLLLDPMTNPSFIRWERREDGVFKFVQSDKVAKLWGQRKQNPRMTYEKLSRAMRYYYKSQVLLPVFGRRLVYKFGPNATGWRPHQVSL